MSKPAVMKAADGNRLVSVINASKRGLGLRGRNLPSRGEYVEVRLQDGVIIGRVAWSSGVRCGIQTQDVIELRTLTEGPLQADPKEATKAAAGLSVAERRGAERHAIIMEASRTKGRLMQFAFTTALIFAAGVFAAETVRSTLSDPLRAAESALGGSGKR